ncbi:MAG: VOC family protein [Lachnospiraceae bacterium]|nr:VOC family protein [Lachnospiraceae bacterium]
MENLFANTGLGKHIIRTHHWGIVLPTVEKAEAFMKTFGLKEDYRGHVKAYDSHLIFTTHGNGQDAIEFIIPQSGVLTEFNKGKGGIAHIAYLVDDIRACQKEAEAMGMQLLEREPVEGTEDIIVNFIRPKFTQGILVELIEQVADINYEATFTSRHGNPE